MYSMICPMLWECLVVGAIAAQASARTSARKAEPDASGAGEAGGGMMEESSDGFPSWIDDN